MRIFGKMFENKGTVDTGVAGESVNEEVAEILAQQAEGPQETIAEMPSLSDADYNQMATLQLVKNLENSNDPYFVRMKDNKVAQDTYIKNLANRLKQGPKDTASGMGLYN